MPAISGMITTNNAATATHDEVFGKGGFRSVTTGLTGGTPNDSQMNAQVPRARRKQGMLVYDISTARYMRCTNAGPEDPNQPDAGTWTEAFTGGFPGAENYVEFTDLPQAPGSGNIDLASQASVDAVLSTCVRVKPDNTIQGLVAGTGVVLTPSYAAKTITISFGATLDGGSPGSPE